MPRNLKENRSQLDGVQLNVDKLGLGVRKPDTNDTIMLVGTVSAAGTGANSAGVSTGGVAAFVFTAEVNGTVYYIPLFSSNA